MLDKLCYKVNKNMANCGNILEHIDPLDLVKQTSLRCFGEDSQEKLFDYLRVFLNRLEKSWL